MPPDVEHSYDGKGAVGAMLFVDPEPREGCGCAAGFTYAAHLTF